MKIKKITLGLIFGSLAFDILFFTIFAIVTYSIFSPFINGFIPFATLLIIAILSIYCFAIQMVTTGTFIEQYLKSYNILKETDDIDFENKEDLEEKEDEE